MCVITYTRLLFREGRGEVGSLLALKVSGTNGAVHLVVVRQIPWATVPVSTAVFRSCHSFLLSRKCVLVPWQLLFGSLAMSFCGF